MLTADKARRAACAANDDFIELKERVAAAVTKACSEGRFEARVALHHDDGKDVVDALCAHLKEVGYRTSRIMVVDRQLLSVQYGEQELRKDDGNEQDPGRAAQEAGVQGTTKLGEPQVP